MSVLPKAQPELPLFLVKRDNPNVAFMVRWLWRHRHANEGWWTAKQILHAWDVEADEYHRRWLRELADKSSGNVAGGQKGYKAIRAMTHDEYNHWRNWMTHQADEMKRRVVEADKVFYRRKAVGERTTDR